MEKIANQWQRKIKLNFLAELGTLHQKVTQSFAHSARSDIHRLVGIAINSIAPINNQSLMDKDALKNIINVSQAMLQVICFLFPVIYVIWDMWSKMEHAFWELAQIKLNSMESHV